MNKYKTTGKQSLFDAENSARKLSEIGSDARADRADDRYSESGHKHLPKMLDLQHVSIRAVRKKRNKITE